MAYLDRNKIETAVLQETHLDDNRGANFACRWASHRAMSTYSTYARSTTKMIRKGFSHKITHEENDPLGRYNILQLTLAGRYLTLIHVIKNP